MLFRHTIETNNTCKVSNYLSTSLWLFTRVPNVLVQHLGPRVVSVRQPRRGLKPCNTLGGKSPSDFRVGSTPVSPVTLSHRWRSRLLWKVFVGSDVHLSVVPKVSLYCEDNQLCGLRLNYRNHRYSGMLINYPHLVRNYRNKKNFFV